MSLQIKRAVFMNCQAHRAEATSILWNLPAETARWANTWTPSSWPKGAQAQAYYIRVVSRPLGQKEYTPSRVEAK